ncbi:MULTISPECIES: hypothetical protein [Nonomuraea]|nr:hypothetical protein [Nonomuraea typhae]
MSELDHSPRPLAPQNKAAVTPEDGEQDGEILDLPVYDGGSGW